MGNREEKQKILDNVYLQISSFDNKANIFITVIGIVFALSLSFLDVFKDCNALTIYAHYNEQPAGYDAEWNSTNCKVYLESQWGQNDEDPERA